MSRIHQIPIRMKTPVKKISAYSLIYALFASCLTMISIGFMAENSYGATLETLRFSRNKVASIFNAQGNAPMQCYEAAGTCGGPRTTQFEQSLPVGGHFKVNRGGTPSFRATFYICDANDSCQSYGNANIYAYKPGEYFLLRFRPANRVVTNRQDLIDRLLVFSLGSADPYQVPIGEMISWTFDSSTNRQGSYFEPPSAASAGVLGTLRSGSTLTGTESYLGIDVEVTRQWKRSDSYRAMNNVGGTDIPGATGQTYTLTDADVGKYIRYSISLRNMHGSVSGVGSDYALVSAAIRLALNPTFSSVVPTLGGFTFNVSNYDPTFTFAATSSAGGVTLGVPVGTNLPVTVTGLTSNQSAQVTITTNKFGFPQGSGNISGVSIESAITPTTGPVGRWIAASIAKQSGTMLIANQGGYLYTSNDNGINWAQRASIQNWSGVTQSDNGQTMFAIVAGGQMYKSIDMGLNWAAVAIARNWRTIACNSDCSVVLAAETEGRLFRSVDFGASWSETESVRNWRSVAVSANGNTMLALPYGGQTYISTNIGATWSTGTGNGNQSQWVSAALSADGSKFFVAPFIGGISYSANRGSTWNSYLTPANTTSISYADDVNRLLQCGNDGAIATSSTMGASVTRLNANQIPWSSCDISSNGNVLIATSTTGLIYVSTDGGGSWTARSLDSGNVKRRAIIADEEGKQLYAAVYGGKLETSLNSGSTWTVALDLVQNWAGLCASNSFGKIYAVAYQGFIYKSMNGGVTWEKVELKKLPWISVACSSDGSTVVAVAKGGQIYNSTDSGVTWVPREQKRKWVGVALSSSGNKAAAVVEGGYIYTSDDSGASWTQRGSARNWSAIASSSNGNKLVATVAQGKLYISSNGGLSWTANDSNRNWVNVVSSASGNKLIAVVGTGRIYTSSNSGSTWTAREAARNWRALFIAGNGNRAFTADYGKKLYSSTDSGETWTAL